MSFHVLEKLQKNISLFLNNLYSFAMKLTLYSAVGLSLLLASCTTLDPEYAEYKKQREAQTSASAQSPYGQNPDPYGAPGGTSGSETGSYSPYQPLPSVNPPAPVSPDPVSPAGSLPPSPSYPTIPSTPVAPAPSGPTTPHLVVKGDSLWGLARRYNTTEDAIRAANGIPSGSSTIQTGRTLQIPSP